MRYEPPANVEGVELEPDPDAPERAGGALPEARVHHALSTGFAGTVAARTACRSSSPSTASHGARRRSRSALRVGIAELLT